MVKTATRTTLDVPWYGGGTRKVEVVTGTGGWWKNGHGLVPVRFVFVHDLTGTHRDEYFFSTDVDMDARGIISAYTGRWSIETTFQEMRDHLGLETTRVRKKESVLRLAPSLFGLYSVVALFFAGLPEDSRRMWVQWKGKKDLSFSDAFTTVRRWLWSEWVEKTLDPNGTFQGIPPVLRETALYALAPAV